MTDRLPAAPRITDAIRRRVNADYERFARAGPPGDVPLYLLDEYGLDTRTEYGGYGIRCPWGKASGQLSMTRQQVADDVAAGLGFVVLKTVIAQDAGGAQSMQAWAVKEARMRVEPIVGRSGESGWTVSWKGRGWWQSFEEYRQLVRDSCDLAAGTDTLIVPSVKYHLPVGGEPWRDGEYAHTTGRLLEAWHGHRATDTMPVEKDFSPTLAGSDLATQQWSILHWLREVPAKIRTGAGDRGVRVGLKLFNALFDDEFQLEMLRTIHDSPDRPDFYVYGNRLFDPDREFEGHRGIAYGGPDLSDRNLRVTSRFLQESQANGRERLPWSATGNVDSGRRALEYALRGATSFQLHTFFQLPAGQYAMAGGSKSQKALHELWFHPQRGFVVWMHHLADALGLPRSPVRFLDVIGRGSAVER